ncbi:MAG: ribonuclease HII [Gemmatimonadetes bacterium]|nr:ribonuclease HII [Gemmatimonadota bacterium]
MARWSRIERDLRASGHWLIAGVDEVGRGPLAGPVVACAIVMPPESRAIRGVADSKALSAEERRRLDPIIRGRALACALGAASVREIERLNIAGATTLAMQRALRRIGGQFDIALVDGRPVRGLGVEHVAVVGGDARCYSVACASIVAKVVRDRLLAALAERHPLYRWERNSGYGTAAHIAGIRSGGLTLHHRASFCRSALAGSEP